MLSFFHTSTVSIYHGKVPNKKEASVTGTKPLAHLYILIGSNGYDQAYAHLKKKYLIIFILYLFFGFYSSPRESFVSSDVPRFR